MGATTNIPNLLPLDEDRLDCIEIEAGGTFFLDVDDAKLGKLNCFQVKIWEAGKEYTENAAASILPNTRDDVVGVGVAFGSDTGHVTSVFSWEMRKNKLVSETQHKPRQIGKGRTGLQWRPFGPW